MPCKIVHLLALAMLLSMGVKAQDPAYRHFTANDGLPSSEVYCVLQDSNGYIWMGTDRGVCRFDGYNFKTFTTNDGLSDNTIFMIYQDAKKRLWFYGLTGRIDYFENNKIHHFRLNREVESYIENEGICCLTVDEKDNLWIGTNGKGMVWKISAKDTVKVPMSARHTFIGVTGNQFVYGNNVTTPNSLIDTIDFVENNKMFSLPFRAMPDSSNRIACVKLQDGSYALAKGHLLLIIKNDKIIKTCKMEFGNFISMYEDIEGHLWITYFNQGTTCYEIGNGILKPLHHYLGNKTISWVFEDREGNLWFSSVTDGLYLLDSKAFLSFTTNNGLKSNSITKLAGNDNILWAGTNNGYLHCFINGNLVKTIKLDNHDNIIQSMVLDSQGNLWVGAVAKSYLLKNGIVQTIPPMEGLRVISAGYHANIWAGRSNLNLFREGKLARQTIPGFNCFLDAICEDESGKVWMGCSNGLWCYDGRKFKYYGDVEPKLKSRVTDIKYYGQNTIWIATLGEGILVKNNNSFTQLTVKNGLLSNLCNRLYIDAWHIVWACTNEGLSMITTDSSGHYFIKNYTNVNGLLSNEVHDVFRQNNKIWAATSGGLNVFDVDEASGAVHKPLIYISGLRINGKDTSIAKKYLLKYNQNNLSINFVGLLFKNAGHIRYRYKMLGLDTNWIVTNFNSAQYSSLQPGDYTFIVNAADDHGNWDNNFANVAFSIALPFWRTSWFWLLCICIVIVVLVIILFIVIKGFVQKNKLYEQLNQYKHHSLSAQMNPHFIFNSLNSIQKYILQNDKISSNKYLTKFANLMRLTLDNSLQTVISLGEEMNALRLYLELEKMRFQDKLEYSIEINPIIDLQSIKIPALLIQPYVENAIRHGIMPKDSTGHLFIGMQPVKDHISCVIEDDGIGRTKAGEYNKMQNRKYRSAGMEITQNRIEIINTLYKKNMQIYVTDLMNDRGDATGTRVNIILPLN